MKSGWLRGSLLAAALWVMPATASADTFLTPYLGTSFGAKFGAAEPAGKLVYGVDLMWLGTSGLGFELDAAFSPNFFNPADDENLFDFDSDGNVVTLMSNLVFGYSGGGVQPYVTGGLGLMRSSIDGPLDVFDVDSNAFGVNAGAGLRLGSGGFGIRGDVRYFRQLSDIEGLPSLDLGDLSYWRAAVGLSFGF